MKLTTKQRREIIKEALKEAWDSPNYYRITVEDVRLYCLEFHPSVAWRSEDVAKVVHSIYLDQELPLRIKAQGRPTEWIYSYNNSVEPALENVEVNSKEEYTFTFFGVKVNTPTQEAMIEHFSQLGINLYYSQSKKEFIRIEDMHLEHLKNVIFNRLESIVEHKSVISLLEIVETPLFKRLIQAWK